MDIKELTYEEILQIVRLFESSSEVNELHLKFGDTVLDLRKNGAAGPVFPTESAPVVDHQSRVALAAAPNLEAQRGVDAVTPADTAPGGPTSPGAFLIKSPTVGTFYCAPEPGAMPFVTVGQRVSPDTTVCIIEVMKLMNSIQAECSGVVSRILVRDGETVEFGQTLIVVGQAEPALGPGPVADDPPGQARPSELTSE